MKANARHVPASTRSCRTPLSRSAIRARRFNNLGKSTYKTQTKFRQKRDCDFFNYAASITYNFSAVKCLNLRGALPVLTMENQSLGIESPDAGPKGPVDRYSFSLGEKVRMTDKLAIPFRFDCRQKNYRYCTKRDKTRRIQISRDSDNAVPTTYNNTSARRLILHQPIAANETLRSFLFPARLADSCPFVLIRAWSPIRNRKSQIQNGWNPGFLRPGFLICLLCVSASLRFNLGEFASIRGWIQQLLQNQYISITKRQG